MARAAPDKAQRTCIFPDRHYITNAPRRLQPRGTDCISAAIASCWSMSFSENRYPPRIKSGAGFFRIMLLCRSVAQSGSAPRSGRGGRRFKSCHSDHYLAQNGGRASVHHERDRDHLDGRCCRHSDRDDVGADFGDGSSSWLRQHARGRMRMGACPCEPKTRAPNQALSSSVRPNKSPGQGNRGKAGTAVGREQALKFAAHACSVRR